MMIGLWQKTLFETNPSESWPKNYFVFLSVCCVTHFAQHTKSDNSEKTESTVWKVKFQKRCCAVQVV